METSVLCIIHNRKFNQMGYEYKFNFPLLHKVCKSAPHLIKEYLHMLTTEILYIQGCTNAGITSGESDLHPNIIRSKKISAFDLMVLRPYFYDT